MGVFHLRSFAILVPTILVILHDCMMATDNQSDVNWTSTLNNTIFSTVLVGESNFTLNETDVSGIESSISTDGSFLNVTTEEVPTTESEDETTPSDASFWTEYSAAQHSDAVPCVCDLMPTSCDVNCCCDTQCSEEDRRVFTSCGMPIPRPDERYCYQENSIFMNNTPYIMIKSSSNLFCIQTDNYPARLQYKDVQVITNVSLFDQVTKKYLPYSWPEQSEKTQAELKVGTPVYVQFNDEAIGYLPLPKSLITGECLSSNPTAYLINAEYKCHQLIRNLAYDCTKNVWLDSRAYFKGFQIVRNPEYLQNASYADEDLLGVTVDLCVNILGVDAACNTTDEFDIPLPSYNASTNTCHNAVSHVRYELTHNETQGIYSAVAKISLGKIRGDDGAKWMQKHAVTFQWAKENSSSITLPPRSGNPGYQTGAKVLAGKSVSKDIGDGKSKDVRIGILLSQDDGNWLTISGASPFTNGLCVSQTEGSSAGSGRISVTFGRDLKSGCHLAVSLQNLTDMCTALQTAALDSLLGWDPPTVVGAYGNSNVSNPGEWVPILIQNKPSASRPVGSVACTNIVRELHIRILHASIGSLSNPQAKIVGVQYRFGAASELRIRCVGRYCQNGAENLTQSFPVTTSVTFVDISEPATPIYAEKPTIRVQLPNDFFYPFVSLSPAFQPNRLFVMSALIATIVFAIRTDN